jgi:hypothetical protein
VIPHNNHPSKQPRHAPSHLFAPSRPADSVFDWEVQLAVTELGNNQERSDALAELTRSTTVSTNAAFARTVLTHPARQHLPEELLDHLSTVHDSPCPPPQPTGSPTPSQSP